MDNVCFDNTLRWLVTFKMLTPRVKLYCKCAKMVTARMLLHDEDEDDDFNDSSDDDGTVFQ